MVLCATQHPFRFRAGRTALLHLSAAPRVGGWTKSYPMRPVAHLPTSVSHADAPENGAVSGLATVTFQVQRHVEFGDNLCLVGGTDALGNWSPDSCVPMDWTEGDNWKVQVKLPMMEDVEYKYIIRRSDSTEVEWQPGANEVTKLVAGSDGLEIVDEWVTEESEEEVDADGEQVVGVDVADAAAGAADKHAVMDRAANNCDGAARAETSETAPQLDPGAASSKETRDGLSEKNQDGPLQPAGA